MTSTPRTAAIIVAAGQGLRSGSSIPKQFAMVAGMPMLAHSHASLARHPLIERVLVVIAAGQEQPLQAALGSVPYTIGGATAFWQSVGAFVDSSYFHRAPPLAGLQFPA